MERTSRFNSPSAGLTLKALLWETRKALGIALAGAMVIHLALAFMQVFGRESQTAKPLTTQFIKRKPRLTKPLELKKRPRPKQRQIQRRMVSVKAKARRKGLAGSVQASQVVTSLARPGIRVERSLSLTTTDVEPEVLAEVIVGTKAPQDRIDMTLEMVDIEALDTGKYHAMVIQDPTDKRNIKGFFHLAIAYSPNIGMDYWSPTYISNMQAIPEVVKAVNNYTQIKTDIAGTYTIDSKELFKIPIIFIIARTDGGFKISRSEASNLGRYFMSGGFAFVEDAQWMLGGFCDVSLRQVLKDALATQARAYEKDWLFERLPSSHPIYHCFFDFDAPPPGDDGPYSQREGGDRPYAPYEYLEGIIIEGRLVTLYSMKALSTAWDWWRPGHWRGGPDNTRQLQFGVNIVVFALTQEGSITHRLMESIE